MAFSRSFKVISRSPRSRDFSKIAQTRCTDACGRVCSGG